MGSFSRISKVVLDVEKRVYRIPCPAKGYRPTCLRCCMGGFSKLPDEDECVTDNGDKVAGEGNDVKCAHALMTRHEL